MVDLHDQKYTALYIQTAREYIRAITSDIDVLLANLSDRARMENIRISAHALKGQSAVMGFDRIAVAAEMIEDLFQKALDTNIPLSEESLTEVSTSLPTVSTAIDTIDKSVSKQTLSENSVLASAQPKKILLVEDDRFFREFYTSKLQESGFTVENAEDGEVAMTKLQTYVPDMILLDLVMPKKDGFTVLGELKQSPRLKNLPVLVFSTLGQEQDVQQALSLGAKGFVNKTFFDFETLLARIHSVIHTVS